MRVLKAYLLYIEKEKNSMKSFFIKNREGQKISVILEKSDNCGLVFIMHGLGGFKEEVHIATIAKAFRDKNFTVVRFDTRHSLGESDGDYSDANPTNGCQDLEDVINWARTENWYREPFVLAGYSMGGGSILWYGANYSDKVSGLALLSTVIGGHHTLARYDKKDLQEWDATGIQVRPGSDHHLNWAQFKKDILQYDMVPEAHKFTMPFLMIVGDQDTNTPLEDHMKLYQKVPEPTEMYVIKGASHVISEASHLKEIENILKKWIDKI